MNLKEETLRRLDALGKQIQESMEAIEYLDGSAATGPAAADIAAKRKRLLRKINADVAELERLGSQGKG